MIMIAFINTEAKNFSFHKVGTTPWKENKILPEIFKFSAMGLAKLP